MKYKVTYRDGWDSATIEVDAKNEKEAREKALKDLSEKALIVSVEKA